MRLRNMITSGSGGANRVVSDASGPGSDGGIVSQISANPILAIFAAIAGFVGFKAVTEG